MYRKLTDQPGLAAVEACWVHTTVMRGGPVAEYRTGELDTILARVREEAAAIAPFELAYGRPEGGRVALELSAYPGEQARRLWGLTTRIEAESPTPAFRSGPRCTSLMPRSPTASPGRCGRTACR